VLLTVTPAAEDQETCVVRSCVLLLLYTPVAYNCTDVPFATEGVAGVVEPCVPVMTIVWSTGAAFTTVRPKGGDVMPFNAAVIFVVMELVGSAAVAMPPAAIVAAAVLLEAQVTVSVTFPVVPSL
jgi:hypothetical protein